MSSFWISLGRRLAVLVIAAAIFKVVPHDSVAEFTTWLQGIGHQVSEQIHKVPTDRLVNQLPKGHLLPKSAESTQPASAKT